MIYRLLSHPLVIVGITVLSLVFFISLQRSGTKTERAELRVRQTEQEVNRLATEVTELQNELEVVQTPIAQERIARNELLLRKEGEYVVQLSEAVRPLEKEAAAVSTLPPIEQWKRLLLQSE